MSESTLNGIRLAAIFMGAALVYRDASSFALPGGVTLLLILYAFDTAPKTTAQSFAFAGTGGFAAAVALLPFYLTVFGALLRVFSPIPFIVIVWLVAAIVIFLIDRARPRNSALATQPMYAPPARTFSVPTAATPIPQQQQPEPAQPVPAPPAVQRPDPSQPRLVRDEPAPVPPEVQSAPEPPPGAVLLKGGKQVDIYVNLLGEGMPMLRSVKAESLGRDYYHIIDTMPNNERWEFKPGQVVRCQKRSLSSGKALVAVEEAPRAQ